LPCSHSSSQIAPVAQVSDIVFLFTDIEGSTERWDRHAEAMTHALRLHDTIVRGAIEEHGGCVFKTIGDAFCAAFAHGQGALAAAIAIQRRLGAADFAAVDGVRVRVALHAGSADERDSDYFGPAVNRVARILSIGHGEQILLSQAAAELVLPHFSDAIELRDLGRHTLKGVSEREQILQLVVPGLRHEFPALTSIDAHPGNLPRQLTAFVGRESERAEIAALVTQERLVSLAGPGGIGKTRLALQVAQDVLEGFEHGVWLIELASISGSGLVGAGAAAALGLKPATQQSAAETLLAYLKAKDILLVFDNCEHVVADAANLVDEILRECPRARVMATTRERLGIAGERVYRTPSLSAPAVESSTTLTANDAMHYGAIALFVELATAARGGFALDDETAPVVAEICRRLDGIALAIELAAARVKVLTIKQLADRLGDRLHVLTGGRRTALPRQQTLRAMIGWSYELLSELERTLFRRLAIFSGGFTLDLMTSACCDATISEFEGLDLLTSLVDKSLVQVKADGEDTRYSLLESMREYAREKLEHMGEYEATARAHAVAYAGFAERLEAERDTTRDADWIARAKPELDNVRSALQWATNGGDAVVGQRLAGALVSTWSRFAPAEGRHWIQTALQSVSSATPVRILAQLELGQARLSMLLQLYEDALAAATRAIDILAPLDDPLELAKAELLAGTALELLSRLQQGEPLIHSALARFRSIGARRYVGAALQYLAVVYMNRDDIEAARPLLGEALAIFRDTGAERQAAHIAFSLAEIEFQSGELQPALELVSDALATNRALDDRSSILFNLCNLCAYLIALGRLEEAQSRAREALAMAMQEQIETAILLALQHLATLAALRVAGESDRPARKGAARLLGYVDARVEALGGGYGYTERRERAVAIDALTRFLGAEELAAHLREGRTWSSEEATREAAVLR
jgi:predicted ATPase/class 3 adenylate cyclase